MSADWMQSSGASATPINIIHMYYIMYMFYYKCVLLKMYCIITSILNTAASAQVHVRRLDAVERRLRHPYKHHIYVVYHVYVFYYKCVLLKM